MFSIQRNKAAVSCEKFKKIKNLKKKNSRIFLEHGQASLPFPILRIESHKSQVAFQMAKVAFQMAKAAF